MMKKTVFLLILMISSTISIAQSNDYVLAENYFRNSEYSKALQVYKKLVRKSPHTTTYLSRLITCYQELGNFVALEKLLSDKLKRKPNLPFLNVYIGNNYERQKNTELAQKYYNAALASIDKQPNYGGTIARIFKNYNKLDFAIAAYKRTSLNNKNANYSFQIAQIYGEKGDFKFMFEEYINYVDSNVNYLNTVKKYTSKYINEDSENENNILFKKALLRKSASNPKNIWNDLLSWLFITQKQYSKALIQQKALFSRDPDYLSGISELGEIAFNNTDYDTAQSCFNFVIENTNYVSDKFNAMYMNLLILIKIEDENIEEKFNAIFKEHGFNSNTLFIQIAYADYLTFKKNNPNQAYLVLEKALAFAENKFQKANIKLKLGDVLVYQNKFNKALIYFSQIQTTLEDHHLAQKARFKVAQTSYFKSDFKWSKAQLKILKGSATQLIANDAADLFLIISDNEPKDSIPTGLKKYAQAELLAYQNKTKEAINLLNEVITTYKNQDIEDEALFKQASLYTKDQKYQEAITNYEKIIALNAQGILVDDTYFNVAEIYNNKLNNTEKASEYYQKIIFEHPSSIYLVDARKKYRLLRGDNI